MPRHGKKFNEVKKSYDLEKLFALGEAITATKENSFVKFDETLEITVNLNVDPRHADQMIRGSIVLPNGTGKKVKVLVIADSEKCKEAEEAGADFYGEEYVEKIQGGWLDFDVAISTPKMMGKVGKLGRVLGPRGLMPNPKTGTVTNDIAKAVKEAKAGKINFRVDKAGIIHAPLGKLSFDADKLNENTMSLMNQLVKMKPASVKGIYMKSATLTSTMGAGYKLDLIQVFDGKRV